MADEDKTKMSDAQGAEAAAWLERTWTGVRACPVCGNSTWHIGQHFVTPVVVTPEGGVSLGGALYPHMLVTSTPCGYSMFVNAIVAGIYSKSGGPKNG
jgi:hypothetical protein